MPTQKILAKISFLSVIFDDFVMNFGLGNLSANTNRLEVSLILDDCFHAEKNQKHLINFFKKTILFENGKKGRRRRDRGGQLSRNWSTNFLTFLVYHLSDL